MYLDITREEITSDLIHTFIANDMASPEKEIMYQADQYNTGSNSEITNRKKMMMLVDDDDIPYLKPDYTKANHKIRHNYLGELVTQCTNYLVGKPIKLDYKKIFDDKGDVIRTKEVETQEDADYNKQLINDELYKYNDFLAFVQENVNNVQLYGKSWMRIVRHNGRNKFVTYDPKEIIEFKNDYDELILVIRYFTKQELVEGDIQDVNYVEVFDHKYKDTYKLVEGEYVKQNEKPEPLYVMNVTYGDVEPMEHEVIDVGVFPLIEWKFNNETIPTLANIKDFIDIQDINISDLANNVDDIQEAIWILENYHGENLRDFMDDLKLRKSIKVGMGGTARPETIEIPIEARAKLYELSTANIYKFGFGINFSERDSLGNVSGVALKWSYAPLEQKANSIEIHGHNALGKLFNVLFKLMDLPYDSNDLEFIFDRTMIANEQEQTQTVMSASSQLSQRTILDSLPMVTDTENEIARLEEEYDYYPTISENIDETRDKNKRTDDSDDETVDDTSLSSNATV